MSESMNLADCEKAYRGTNASAERDCAPLPDKVLKPQTFKQYTSWIGVACLAVAFVYFAWMAWNGLHEMKTTGCTVAAVDQFRVFCGMAGWLYAWLQAVVCVLAAVGMASMILLKPGQRMYPSNDIAKLYQVNGVYWYGGDFSDPETDPAAVAKLRRANDGDLSQLSAVSVQRRHLPLSTFVSIRRKEGSDFVFRLATIDITAEGMTLTLGVCPKFPLVQGRCHKLDHSLFL
ncbi:hypothetical protein OZX62_01125 [Bifidobacterium sp. ESL0690]|uniref:hypothetical protein n=1 Tax=Bifidobacterium sp. ESL0690 TaxID=2983214 RepID=UPI0023F6F2E7|nr:hypothetical protein [Bifidobacterium sp. ESL0690]WEV46930.1 hypothetical protein OZX62_01125 [Bifidobacterium sp. ESL0690]